MKTTRAVANKFLIGCGNHIHSLEAFNALEDAFTEAIRSYGEEVKEECAKSLLAMRVKHELDAEMYIDTSGGCMCVACGKSGFDPNEVCDVEENRILTNSASAIRALELP